MMFSGGGEGDGLGRINMMPTAAMLSPTAEISPRGPPQQQPQWGLQETKEFIGIRAELEKDFTVTKRNKTLWEIGKETSDPETGRQCPFFEELHAVFTERAKNMQRLLLESEAGSTQSRKKMKRTSGDRSSDEFSEEEDEDEDDSEEEKPVRSNSRKRKVEKIIAEKSPRASSSTVGGIQEMLKEFLQQQQKMEMQWREMMERRSHERQMFEQEWRQSMEKLERERLMIEQAWREREEQRRIREESRAERRDALLTTLLNKLIRENNI
ncbi:hypothetical protein D5086_001173 [Populus alba]|uniref:Uncharacterized protein n=1 Tax=Populus alba TaxID=43335 RepID=A0ACC4CYE4_POPAL